MPEQSTRSGAHDEHTSMELTGAAFHTAPPATPIRAANLSGRGFSAKGAEKRVPCTSQQRRHSEGDSISASMDGGMLTGKVAL